ncbi:hypothetical protein [Raoultella terrigena]|uniref:hypothetical protein n=1 Tax=Raoultella terrigena TaxID=577 RepID=UPI003F5D5302
MSAAEQKYLRAHTSTERQNCGIEATEIKKMKDPEDKNRHLKPVFANLRQKCWALKNVIENA